MGLNWSYIVLQIIFISGKKICLNKSSFWLAKTSYRVLVKFVNRLLWFLNSLLSYICSKMLHKGRLLRTVVEK